MHLSEPLRLFNQGPPQLFECDETPPACALTYVSSAELDGQGHKRLTLRKPDTTFSRELAATSPMTISGSGASKGTAFRSGEFLLAYDPDSWSGDPVASQICGAKPGSWKATYGFPGCVVETLISTDPPLILARFEPITTLVGLSGGIAAADDTDNYTILYGHPEDENDSGFTTVPSAYNPGGIIAEGKLIGLTWTPATWIISPLTC